MKARYRPREAADLFREGLERSRELQAEQRRQNDEASEVIDAGNGEGLAALRRVQHWRRRYGK